MPRRDLSSIGNCIRHAAGASELAKFAGGSDPLHQSIDGLGNSWTCLNLNRRTVLHYAGHMGIQLVLKKSVDIPKKQLQWSIYLSIYLSMCVCTVLAPTHYHSPPHEHLWLPPMSPTSPGQSSCEPPGRSGPDVPRRPPTSKTVFGSPGTSKTWNVQDPLGFF